jgi:hypothetical protein
MSIDSTSSQPPSQPGIYFIPVDSAEYARYQQFRAMSSSSSHLDQLQATSTVPTQQPTQLDLSPSPHTIPSQQPIQLPVDPSLSQHTVPPQQPTLLDPTPGLTPHPHVSLEDANWHWTDHRALYRSIGIDPDDRSTVQTVRQEVRQYVRHLGYELNVAWTKWDPVLWRRLENTVSKEFAARRGWTRKDCCAILKQLCRANHRNEGSRRRRSAGNLSLPRASRHTGRANTRQLSTTPSSQPVPPDDAPPLPPLPPQDAPPQPPLPPQDPPLQPPPDAPPLPPLPPEEAPLQGPPLPPQDPPLQSHHDAPPQLPDGVVPVPSATAQTPSVSLYFLCLRYALLTSLTAWRCSDCFCGWGGQFQAPQETGSTT